MLVHWTGHRGSLFVTPVLGGAVVTQSEYEREGDGLTRVDRVVGGPLVGVSLEWQQ